MIMHDDGARTSGGVAQPDLIHEVTRARRILCATDLTARSEDAERRASLLARQMNAEVMFVHAMGGSRSQRARRMMFARTHMQLLSRADRVMAHARHDARVSVRHGTPLQAITETAGEWAPDLIVMARPPQRTLDLVLGTTAERVIRATHRPVLVVSGTASGSYRNVLLATDMSNVSVHVARTLLSMGLLEEAYTWIVHAFDPPYHGLLSSHRAEANAYRRQWRRVLSAELLQRMSAEGVDLSRVDVVVELARPLDAIQQCLQTSRPELLVIGTSRWFMLKRILFGSVADQVLRHVDCDVLAISPPARAAVNGMASSRAAAPSMAPADRSLPA